MCEVKRSDDMLKRYTGGFGQEAAAMLDGKQDINYKGKDAMCRIGTDIQF